MSKPNDGGAAFARPLASMPGRFSDAQEGMSLRDWFAGKALQGQCTPFENGWALHKPDHREMMAAECYAIADAMLKARMA